MSSSIGNKIRPSGCLIHAVGVLGTFPILGAPRPISQVLKPNKVRHTGAILTIFGLSKVGVGVEIRLLTAYVVHYLGT